VGQGDNVTKQGPPRSIEKIVALLTPPARREEVLGDLHERYASPQQYVTDAIRAVPLVVASQIRRTTDLGVLFLEAFSLYFCFFAGMLRLSGASILPEQPRALSLLIPTAVALVVLRFVDAYASGRKRSTLKLILGTATAVAFAFLPEAALSLAGSSLALSGWDLLRGGILALALLSLLRTAFPSGAGAIRPAAAAVAEQATPFEALRHSSAEFEARIRRRNLREYIAAGFVLVIFGANLATTHIAGARVGYAFIIAGTLYIIYQLHKRGSAKSAPVDANFAACVDFHRRELERQRDLLRHIWSWYLGPLIPGMLGLMLSAGIAHPDPSVFVSAASVAGVFLAVARLNHKGAQKLQRKIDELNRIGAQSS
jgi:hypothetical protein